MTDKAVLGGEGILLQSYKQAGPEQDQEAKVTFISGSQKLGPVDPPPRSGRTNTNKTIRYFSLRLTLIGKGFTY